MKVIYLLATIFAVCVFCDPPTPFWGGNPVWSTKMSLIYIDKHTQESQNFTAAYFYNWNLKAERYNYDANQNDEMCKASGFQKWDFVRCNVIYAKDGWSYVEFPDNNYCCKCTNTFGAVRYDWIQENSTYAGRSTLDGVTVDQWYKKGNPELNLVNNYYVTVGDQKPVRFYETNGVMFKDIHYDLSSYSTASQDPSTFEPPANCQTQCPGVCKTLKQKSNLKTE